MTSHYFYHEWIHNINIGISSVELNTSSGSYTIMARCGTIIAAITSLAFICNCLVNGQLDPERPKLSESFSAEVRVTII